MQTLYEKFGGQAAISKVVDIFYDKVLADPTVNHFFKHTDMEKQRKHQSLFISWVLGGPNQYSGKSMAKAHEGMNLDDKHFTSIANHLADSLRHFNVSEEDIQDVLTKLATMKSEILYK
ncbi:group I truncated hemoglobin [Bacillus massilinigeriensis]|uniref:group I truncated hemoglobin n=1 Tax=Bacillus mediterraneensis TaxID=1805474 RepID=UPI0008F9665A|nr:group 1 truncated hemoglobin [Bacillus mediterraneensis]